MKEVNTPKEMSANNLYPLVNTAKEEDHTSEEKMYPVMRVAMFLMAAMMFIPAVNPTRVCALISENNSLFTSAVSYSNITANAGRALRMGWVDQIVFTVLFIASLVMVAGIIAIAAGGCLSLGNLKMKNLGNIMSVAGSVVTITGYILCVVAYRLVQGTTKLKKVRPAFNNASGIFIVLSIVVLAISIFLIISMPKAEKNAKYEMESQYKLFLLFLPFATLAFVFAYLPLWGWRYAFFDYKSGGSLSMENFVGFKWFTYMFKNEATRADVFRVLRNTLVMSGLGIATSWIPMAFAVFLSEIKNTKFRRIVQTFTTIPNFISWVLVYAIAMAIFSTDGFINSFAASMGWIDAGTNYLMGDNFTWLKMLGWGLWKGIGWNAIIYIAGISGIDQQLYEAATVDGAGRFQKMWHVTLPGLIPTYMVLLLMSVAGILSNGMDQYLVFSNATNSSSITVLDLYVYKLGIEGGSIALSTVIGMVKSVVSVILLFVANSISKVVRGESII